MNIIDILENNKDIIIKMGWIVSEPYSYKWWGGLDSADKIAISAFLVQLTKWETVKKVIDDLSNRNLDKIDNIANISIEELDNIIKPVNFHKTKAIRLKKFANKAIEMGGLSNLLRIENRELLISLDGIGDETADSLLLFAGNNAVLPSTEYLKRVLERIYGKKFTKKGAKEFAEKLIEKDLYKYKLFHAGIVSVGKAYCRLTKPKCEECIFKGVCKYT